MMSLLSLPPELLYMVVGYLEYDSEFEAMRQAFQHLRPIYREPPRPHKTKSVKPITIVRELKELLAPGNENRLRNYLHCNSLLRDVVFARAACAKAVTTGQSRVVKVLLTICPLVLKSQPKEGSPSLLDLAVSRNQFLIRDYLISLREFLISRRCVTVGQVAPVQIQIPAGLSPVISAVELRSLEAVRLAIEEQKCDIHSLSRVARQLHVARFVQLFHPMEYCTPLWIAAANGSVEIVQYLLSQGANANSELFPVIFVAAHQNHVGVVSFLLDVKEHPKLEQIYPGLWLSLLCIKTDATALLYQRLDLSAMCTHFCDMTGPEALGPDLKHLSSLLVLAIKISNREAIQHLMESRHADNICQYLILQPDFSKALHTFFSFDKLARETSEDLLFLIDCIAQKSAHLLAQVCETIIKRHGLWFEIFLQRYPQVSSHILSELKDVVIDAKKRRDIPLLTTLLRNHVKYITETTWQKLLGFRIDLESWDVFLELGALDHINAEHVRDYLQCAFSGFSRTTLNTWLSVLDRFNLNLHSKSTKSPGFSWRYPDASYMTLFEYGIATCDYRLAPLLLARPEVNFVPTDDACQKALKCILEKGSPVPQDNPQKVKLFLEKGFDPMQPLPAKTLTERGLPNRGMPILHCAVIHSCHETVKLLLEHGADPLQGLFQSGKSKFTTALGLAARHHRYPIIKIILQHLEARKIRITWLLRLLPLTQEDQRELRWPEHQVLPSKSRELRSIQLTKILRQQHWRFMYPVPGDD
ncbi:hypothetical protein N7508_000121 [Penicillium antarcticum]|uniref:uncharacterized protein n=1 Tax=Penicillium antarcticum TaxID=416450 RepID=UPI00238B6690|nr:uncharacterized protein N7508_000121 [Penicillium antarcticum]KAJ5319838.1 hypothetical protein N7508_000121 [Penicillium antarcticum]